jgi:tyrosine-protein phosphatase SIW14
MRPLASGFLCLFLASGVGSSHAQAPPIPLPAVPSVRAEKIRIAGVPNAGQVSDQLYRGAQPELGSIAQLKKIGITTIVDLRAEDPGLRDREREEAGRLGIKFVAIPVGGWSNPTNQQIVQFLSLFNGQPRIFVHCRLGKDRSGVFVAAYRIAIQKWPAEKAMREMNDFGFNEFWHPGMMAFVRNFPVRLSSVPALAALSGPVSSRSPASSVSTIISPN